MIGYKQDWIESLRGWLIPKLGIFSHILEEITGEEFYVESETHRDQFVGRVPMNEESFEKELDDMNFHRNPLAAWKARRKDPEDLEEGSWRKVGYDENPRMQLHVVLYDGSPINNADVGCTYVYAHWEYRWDTDPVKHYRGVDYNAGEGVRRVKKLLDENGISYEPIRP